jgi:hypothetical protein
MGMFDYFTIEYPLPLESYVLSKYRSFVHAAVGQDEFQCKDMDCCLDRYLIDNAGRIYKSDLVDFELDERTEFKKIYFHGHINVYSMVYLDEEGWGSKNKFWLEYDLKFTDGLLVQATMTSPTEEELQVLSGS